MAWDKRMEPFLECDPALRAIGHTPLVPVPICGDEQPGVENGVSQPRRLAQGPPRPAHAARGAGGWTAAAGQDHPGRQLEAAALSRLAYGRLATYRAGFVDA